tara:strand:- start:44 stop:1048 length:1005 start_codon:yes stop_codon:yes gene_type:complete
MANRKLKINNEYGKTAGYASPGEVRNVYNNLLVTQRDVEKWIAKQFEGIDLKDKSKENLARIAQRKKIVKDLWNEWDGKKFVNRPKSMQHLGKTVRGKHNLSTRALQIGSMIPSLLALKGVPDTSEKKIGGISDPYEIIERLNSMQVKIEGVSRIRDGKDVNPNALADLGMTISQPFNKESNVYFNPDLDRTNTTRDLADSRKARLTYKNKFPSQYAANPGGYLSTLQPTNQFFNSPTGEAKSPLSISQTGEYFGQTEAGATPWTDRSVRGPGQADADTRALLIQKTNNERAVNRLSSSQLSRYRISGGFESDKGVMLTEDGRSQFIKRLTIGD